jgi:phosphate transport system protein
MAEHFFNLLDELMRRSLRMASAVEDVIKEALSAVAATDHVSAQRIIDRDEEIDREEVEIESEALRLMTLYQPMGSDMRRLCTILKVNGDLERIADCAVNIAERVRHLEPESMDSQTVEEMREIEPIVLRMLHNVVHAYATTDSNLAWKVREEDEIVDALYAQCIRRMIAEASQEPEDMARHLDILAIAKNLESIGDQACNIAEDVIYLATGEIVRHTAS